jgi:hypothetical protein
MSDFRSDPNFSRNDMTEYDTRVQWAAVAVILLLVGGLIVAAAWTGGETQMASNAPSIETAGAAPSGSTATMPAPPRQMRH